MKEQREQFTEYAKLNAGIPFFWRRQNTKTAHMGWGDGSIHHYHEFHAALDSEGLNRELHEIFQRRVADGTIKTNRTELGYGGVHGALSFGPHALADEVQEAVLRHFNRALEIVATRIRTGTTYLDELRREVASAAGHNPPEART